MPTPPPPRPRRAPAAARAALPALLLVPAACRSVVAPPLAVEPWEPYREGAVVWSLRPGVFTLYAIDGDFSSENVVTGEPVEESDEGDLEGRVGAAARVDWLVTDATSVGLGVDWRAYDVEGLSPIPSLDVVELDTATSWQVFVAVRHALPPLAAAPRLRPFVQGAVAWVPGFELEGEIDLSAFGSSDLPIESDTDGYWLAAASAGLLWHWRDRLVAEVGVVYEHPLTDLEGRIDVDSAFLSLPPIDAELRPHGFLGFVGLSWIP